MFRAACVKKVMPMLCKAMFRDCLPADCSAVPTQCVYDDQMSSLIEDFAACLDKEDSVRNTTVADVRYDIARFAEEMDVEPDNWRPCRNQSICCQYRSKLYKDMKVFATTEQLCLLREVSL